MTIVMENILNVLSSSFLLTFSAIRKYFFLNDINIISGRQECTIETKRARVSIFLTDDFFRGHKPLREKFRVDCFALRAIRLFFTVETSV